MTILNPKAIIDKLEKDGVETVKKKIQKGFYRADKLPLVRKWLAEKVQGDAEVEVSEGEGLITDTDKEPDKISEPTDDGQGKLSSLDVEEMLLANKTDEEYEASDAKTKRAITMARKKVAVEKE